jgi:hypothetical protein
MKLQQTTEFPDGPYLIGHITSGDHPIQWKLFTYNKRLWRDDNGQVVDIEEDFGIDLEFDYVFRLPGTPIGLEAWDHPQYLYRQHDGTRLTKNPDGTYSMDNSEMFRPHKWTYERLMNDHRCVGHFGTEPPTEVEPPKPPKGGGCGRYEDDGCGYPLF